MRLVVAGLFAGLMIWAGLGMLRSLGMRPHKTFDQPVDATDETRVVFWCQTCDTELLLLRRGSDKAPRHCGESMHEREEVGR